MVCAQCNLCRRAAVDPAVNRCGHLFCWPCLRDELRRRSGEPFKCPSCGRRVSPPHLTTIYGQQRSSGPRDDGDNGGGWCARDDGCPPGSPDVAPDMMDVDGSGPADAVMMDADGSGADPMDVDDGGGDGTMGFGPEEEMAHLECHICLDDAEEPVVTPCGHVYCCPCLFQWLDGRRRKCPMCKNPVSESKVTLVVAAPAQGGERRPRS
uniref:E3 ubiquitin-protein ligase RMA n=1 Tax=Anthurium amnicola TaxID=1678845 RepID=A0A1D1XEI7_9ARAE